MDLSLLTVNTVIAFLLVLFRISGMMVSAPLFNMRNIPAQLKVGMAVSIALILFPLHAAQVVIPKDLIQFSLMAVQETVIGILIGFTANLVFIALQMAGEYVSMQMGLSVANMLDPVTQTQSPIVGQFFFYFAALLFLSLNIHHGLIVGVDRSFNWIPLGHFIGEGHLTGGLMAERFIKLTGDMFVMALMIGVPLMGILLATEIALSFVAKVMPQMNVFMVGMPLKVALGLLAIMWCMPYLGGMLGEQYSHLIKVLLGLYKT
ncbi:MAG: flagellar biosynthesis protein FliR [Vampirovibrio sp.]|nr:flagellar biosynthesis protein FliR [Vampirovibrio sp.]